MLSWSDSSVNDTDLELQCSVDRGLANHNTHMSTLQTSPEPVVIAIQNDDDQSSTEDNIGDLDDNPLGEVIDIEVTDDNDVTLGARTSLEEDIPIDPRDPEWTPPPTQRSDSGVQSQYSLRPRVKIVAPRRSLSE